MAIRVEEAQAAGRPPPRQPQRWMSANDGPSKTSLHLKVLVRLSQYYWHASERLEHWLFMPFGEVLTIYICLAAVDARIPPSGRLTFATNAGMVHPPFKPLHLNVERGWNRLSRGINTGLKAIVSEGTQTTVSAAGALVEPPWLTDLGIWREMRCTGS